MKYIYEMRLANGDRCATHCRLWVEDALALMRTGGTVHVFAASKLERGHVAAAEEFVLRSRAQLDEFCNLERDEMWFRGRADQSSVDTDQSSVDTDAMLNEKITWDDCLWFGEKLGYTEGVERNRATRLLAVLVGLVR